jgi:hypothetical protein
MKKPIVIIGIGEIGGVFARGLLRCGYPVYPITRLMDVNSAAHDIPEPELVLVSVGEDDLHPVLDVMPPAWADRLVLLQNELLPRDWQGHDLQAPTVISVWFEKKKGQDVKVLLPSPVFGRGASIVAGALEALGIPARTVADEHAMLMELVRKNLYILTSNVAGLIADGTVEELWRDNRQLAQDVAADVLELQASLTGTVLPRDELLRGMVEGFEADPHHRCTGRTAPQRLERALRNADAAGLQVPTLREIQSKTAT